MRKFLFFVLIIFFAFPLDAWADPDMEVFKKRMEDAAIKTKDGDLTGALLDYLEIRSEFSGPELDYSLGRIYQRLHQCTEAQYFYTQLMMVYNLPEKHPILLRAIEGYDKIAACQYWGKLELECVGSKDAWLEIDGEKLGDCMHRPYSLESGEHVLALRTADGLVSQTKLSITDGEAKKLKLELKQEPKVVEKTVEIERRYILKDRFHPALYWGLIAGGAAVLGGSGYFAAGAYKHMVDVQRYEDRRQDDLASKSRDSVKLYKILTYSSLGLGGALLVTGVTLAIVNAVSEKELVEEGTSAYVSPLDGGAMFGFTMQF